MNEDTYYIEKQRVWDEVEKAELRESGIKKVRKKSTNIFPKKKRRK